MMRLLAAIWLLPAMAGALTAQTTGQTTTLTDADHAIEGLRQAARDLTDAVRRFHSDLDEAIDRYDRGYRAADGRQMQGADAGLTGGPADIVQESVRRFAAWRMLSARDASYQPPPVADMDRIQNLIEGAHRRIEAGTGVLSRLLVVSAKDFDPHRDALMKSRHEQLLKARAAAEDASKQAWLALPIDLPDGGSSGDSSQKAWDILSRGWPNGPRPGVVTPAGDAKEARPAIPIRIYKRKRVTLVSNASYRMALTDSGIDDADGRRLFYQEEWIQRGTSVIRVRWRVAVDRATGQHVLVTRYPALELRGALDDLYREIDRYSLWYLEPGDDSGQPSADDVEAALADVEDARVSVRMAVDDFQNTVRASLAQQDGSRAIAGEALLDAGLAAPIRESLYAIRAHLAGVPASLAAENKVWAAITQGTRQAMSLEAAASWGNPILQREPAGSETAARWEDLMARSDRAIDLLREADIEAAGELPPNSTQAEAKFPALQRGVIVRIRRPSAQHLEKGLIMCRQEIWHMESPMPGAREVRRTATLVAVDPRTGAQTAVAGRTKYYPVDAGDILENVFDEHSADDLPVALVD